MKKSVHFTALLIIASLFLVKSASVAQVNAISDSVIMGPGYADEIYYSMTTGSVLVSPRNTWDIAFRTRVMSSSILTNDGKGVVLYTYPKSDTSGWSSLDTTGLYGWTPLSSRGKMPGKPP